jgi:hypothetical protein
MKAFAFVLVSVFALATPALVQADDYCGSEFVKADDTDAVGDGIDAKGFFEATLGQYTVLKSGGATPHAGDMGTVEIEDGQAVLTFSYCPPTGGCDPNYVFLEFAKTKVFQRANNAGGAIFTIQSQESGKPTKFTWDVTKDGTISLKNYQYLMPPNATPVVLEHIIKKK